MKSALALSLSILALSPTLALAGGSSVVGPGAPQFEYRCGDAAQNVQVDIVRMWPNYDEIKIGVATYVPMNVVHDVVERIPGDRPGASLQFKGERFELSVRATSPLIREGQPITFRAFLRDKKSWQADKQLELDCVSPQQ